VVELAGMAMAVTGIVLLTAFNSPEAGGGHAR
jgi:hypothetical protein